MTNNGTSPVARFTARKFVEVEDMQGQAHLVALAPFSKKWMQRLLEIYKAEQVEPLDPNALAKLAADADIDAIERELGDTLDRVTAVVDKIILHCLPTLRREHKAVIKDWPLPDKAAMAKELMALIQGRDKISLGDVPDPFKRSD